jgi:hypothetical protein
MRLQINEGVGDVLGFGADLAFAGSQLDHAFPETDGSERSQKNTKALPVEFRRPLAGRTRNQRVRSTAAQLNF